LDVAGLKIAGWLDALDRRLAKCRPGTKGKPF
jgi:hypothetical protein